MFGIIYNLNNNKLVWNLMKNSFRHAHVYREISPWMSNRELAKDLIKHILFYENGLLVINKPYGVTFSRDGSYKPPKPEEKLKKMINHQELESPIIKETYESTGIVNDDLSLLKALPYIQEELGVDKLFIVKVPERYTSGIAILATEKSVEEKVQLSILKSRYSKESVDTFQAVVIGKPRYNGGKIKLGLTLDVMKGSKQKKPILLREWSNNAVKRGEVLLTTFSYQLLRESEDSRMTLVEIRCDRKKWHCVRLFCSNFLLTPVLGDNLYGGRVKNVMGVTLPVNHWSKVSEEPQKLSSEVLSILEVTKEDLKIIPTHLHLSKVILPHYDKKGLNLELVATPPDFFTWTCQKSSLVDPGLQYIQKNVN
uniref:Pseudouridine synthase RsuA/RluA-like domain-containing protein n=1 Tax=Clastoptera arizonana TaxID=38151 RepID=A0A1B6DM60_9HEMI